MWRLPLKIFSEPVIFLVITESLILTTLCRVSRPSPER